MNRRYLLLALVAAALCLNLWYWWPASPLASVDKRSTGERWSLDALRVNVAIEAEKSAPSRRDLFQPRVAIVKAAPPPKAVTPPPAPPPKTPEEIAEEAARAELAQIKLVGIVFRGEAGEAFLVKGDQVYIVRNGQKVGERFAVESVGADTVSLKDPSTRVSGKLSVSGK
jgi:Tfp pilus assembly protein PilP